MARRRVGRIVFFTFVAAGMTVVSARALASSSGRPDLEYGAYLASECSACHRFHAGLGVAIPDLSGMSPETFVEVMKAYRAKLLPNQVMQLIAARFNDDDLASLAAFFASKKR